MTFSFHWLYSTFYFHNSRFSEVNAQESVTPEVPPPGIDISFRVEEGGGRK